MKQANTEEKALFEGNIIDPSFVIDNNGDTKDIKTFIKNKYLVILVYIKNDSPYCQLQLKDFSRSLELFRELGAEIIAISTDSFATKNASSKKVVANYSFPILSDKGGTLLKKWGLLNIYDKSNVAVPTVLVIDSEGIVKYRSMDRTSARVMPETLLRVIRQNFNTNFPQKTYLLSIKNELNWLIPNWVKSRFSF